MYAYKFLVCIIIFTGNVYTRSPRQYLFDRFAQSTQFDGLTQTTQIDTTRQIHKMWYCAIKSATSSIDILGGGNAGDGGAGGTDGGAGG